MLATSQESIEMKMALVSMEKRTSQLNAQLKKLDEVTKKTDEFLYQMIPKAVADRLIQGQSPIEMYESVTMLFSGM